jgi:hypothetical protein
MLARNRITIEIVGNERMRKCGCWLPPKTQSPLVPWDEDDAIPATCVGEFPISLAPPIILPLCTREASCKLDPLRSNIFFVRILLLVMKRVEAGKNELVRELRKGDTRFVFFGEEIGNIKGAGNVMDAGMLEADTVTDANLTNIHMAQAFRQGRAPTPVNGPPVVVVQRGGVSYIGQTDIGHDVVKPFDRLGPFVH